MKRRDWISAGVIAGGSMIGTGLFRALRNRRTDSRLEHRGGPIALPPNFNCIEIARAGERLSDGSRGPDMPDGMACFLGDQGEWILLRNHELGEDSSTGAFPSGQPDLAYRESKQGGVSRLVLNPKDLTPLSSNIILTGTHRNCGGGPSPWGWLSCEESDDAEHGYTFVCPPNAERLRAPEKIPAYGRFRHEAAAVDPTTLRAYLTEDQSDGCLYRFTPRSLETPFEGQLEALRVKAHPHFDTGEGLKQKVQVEWVPITDPEAHRQSTREQAHSQGAARFRRGEGAWWTEQGCVFTATSGGSQGLGQIFLLSPQDELRLVAESKNEAEFRGPDNITQAPWGDFIVAEDTLGNAYIRGVTAQGEVYAIAYNELSFSEFAGVCFSPDGSTLFVNIQSDGLTLAIQGPWDSLRSGLGGARDT